MTKTPKTPHLQPDLLPNHPHVHLSTPLHTRHGQHMAWEVTVTYTGPSWFQLRHYETTSEAARRWRESTGMEWVAYFVALWDWEGACAGGPRAMRKRPEVDDFVQATSEGRVRRRQKVGLHPYWEN